MFYDQTRKSKKEGGNKMPSLKQLLEELAELGFDPRGIRLPPALYDELLDQTEDEADEED